MNRSLCTECKKVKRSNKRNLKGLCSRHSGRLHGLSNRESFSRVRKIKTFKKAINESVPSKSSQKRKR